MQLNESETINIADCTNINLSQLEELHSNMEFYSILSNTFTAVREEVNDPISGPIHYCTWINTRIPDYCTGQDHVILNDICGDTKSTCAQPCN